MDNRVEFYNGFPCVSQYALFGVGALIVRVRPCVFPALDESSSSSHAPKGVDDEPRYVRNVQRRQETPREKVGR